MSDSIMSVYNRAPLAFVRGRGVWLYTEDGEAYLDCVGGVATNALGHAHPRLVEALDEQAKKLWHVSNIFQIPEQQSLAERLTSACFADVAFFCNSGTEAVECALKTARRYHVVNGTPERIDVIGFEGSFHGRSYAAINASGNPSYLDGFGPRLPGYIRLRLDDHDAIAAAIANARTAAVIVEPVQGEGGARAVCGAQLQSLRRLCSEHGVLLIYDEVQSGMGRTGQLFAHQWHPHVEPDIMAIAKALGCGFPIGACLATSEAAKGMTSGVHGSTFGGNPLAVAVAIAAFDEISRTQILAHARMVASEMNFQLTKLMTKFPDVIGDIRGKGLLIGIRLIPNNRDFQAVAREQRLLVALGGENCVRLLPPLNLKLEEASEAIDRLAAACVAMRSRLERAA